MSKKAVPAAVQTSWPDLHDAIWRTGKSGNVSTLCKLLESGADISKTADVHSATELSVLHTAADTSTEIVDLLIHYGAAAVLESECGPGEVRRWCGSTPLQMAADKSNERNEAAGASQSVVDLLMQHGATIDIFAAAALGRTDDIRAQLSADAALATLSNSFGTTPLHWATRNGNLQAAELLLSHSADIDAPDSIGFSPLWYAACSSQDKALVRFLCDRGANITLTNVWGKTILDYDIGRECSAIISVASS